MREYTTNIIAENIYSQIDDEVQQYTLIDKIAAYKQDELAITKENGLTYTKSGIRVPTKITRG